MNIQAGLILLIPLMGLAAICRGGKWNWKVVENKFANYIVWFGWCSSLIVGVLSLFSII